MILHRHDRVLEVGGDPAERDVAAVLVEAKPRAAAGIVENGVADAAIEPIDRPAVAHRPHRGHRQEDQDDAAGGGDQPIPA